MEKIVTTRHTDGKRNSRIVFCIPPRFATWQTVRPTIHSAHTSCIKMAAMIRLRSSGRSCGRGGRKTPQRIPIRKTAWRYVRRSRWPAKQRMVCGLASYPASGQMPLALPARTNKLGEFLFLYVIGKLKSFPPFKCTDFVNMPGNYA